MVSRRALVEIERPYAQVGLVQTDFIAQGRAEFPRGFVAYPYGFKLYPFAAGSADTP